jgi:deoxycytidine triphosphate deaminase
MKHILGANSTSKLTGVIEGDAQPNAVDLRLGKVFEIHKDRFEISNQFKKHRGSWEISPDQYGWYTLNPGAYEVVMENTIEVGDNEAGWVVTRSTLIRNGVFITSGLYDTGYHGVMAAVMHVGVGQMKVQQGTRIGQYLSFAAEALHKYDGDYGLKKDHDQKYGETK